MMNGFGMGFGGLWIAVAPAMASRSPQGDGDLGTWWRQRRMLPKDLPPASTVQRYRARAGRPGVVLVRVDLA